MEQRPSDDSLNARSARRVRWFKRAIVLTTAGVAAAMIAASSTARFQLRNGAEWIRTEIIRRVTGLEPDRNAIDADWARRRAHSIDLTHAVLSRFYKGTSEEMRALFRVAGMDPAHGLIRYGRGDEAFLISPQVFEGDDHGRSYRLRPDTRSVWLREVTLNDGPFGLFQVLDTPEHRAAAVRAGAIVDERSIQNTNAWGLRGPEPDPTVPLRGVVLGDSFMQAMFNGDDETPSARLVVHLKEYWNQPVSIANTGHIGYSPEQYYFALAEYGPRMDPLFVIVSVCPNDFGGGSAVLAGGGDWFDEAGYWLEKIQVWCRARSVLLLLVPVPTYIQLESRRREAFYPGRICNIFRATPLQYFDPVEDFIDANLRLKREALRDGALYLASALYNHEIHDDHFSPRGADVWARAVSRRLSLLLETQAFGRKPPARTGHGASVEVR